MIARFSPHAMCRVLLVLSVSVAGAHAQDGSALPASVSLVQDPCVAPLYDEKSLVGLLTVELRAIGVDQVKTEAPAAEGGNAGLALVSMGCAATEGTALLRVADFASHKRIEREMILSDVKPGARPRAIAIAIVELLESSWAELVTQGATPAIVLPETLAAKLRARLLVAPDSAVAAPVASAAPAREQSVRLALVERIFPARATSLLGARLGYARTILKRVVLHVDADVMRGGVDLEDAMGRVGHIDMTTLNGELGMGVRSRTQPSLSFGPVVDLGYAIGHAKSTRAGVSVNDSQDVIASVALQTRLDAELADAWAIGVGVDLGYMLAGADLLAGNARLAGLSNLTLTLDTGIVWKF